jgi:hypothetical protein
MCLVFVVVCSIIGTLEIGGRENVVVDFLLLNLQYCLVLGLCCFLGILGINYMWFCRMC